MNTIQNLRGMNDILQNDAKLFLYFVENASKIAQKHGYSYLQTPILEMTSLFKRGVGNSSDIVNKEMYAFIDKGGNDVCLRPEGTAGAVRSFIQNKFDKAGGSYKFYYYGNMFRYERPQKGRLRQFNQFGCESFGEDSIYEDANIICMLKEILDFFKIGFKLELNSLGCEYCMPKYKEKLVNELNLIKDELCEDCNKRIETNPIRVFDCKIQSCKRLLISAPQITDNLCQSCNSDFEKIKEILDENGIKYEINKNLVRGLDYYTQTAFEFVSDEIGAQNAIAGGGRYNKLVELLGGKPTVAIGFAMGIERLLELIKINEQKEELYYFGVLEEKCISKLFTLYLKKAKSEKCHIEYNPRSFNKHFKIVEKLGATKMILLGNNELETQNFIIKDLNTKEEKKVSFKEFL